MTRDNLIKNGYVEVSHGCWAKVSNPRQAPIVEPHPRPEPLAEGEVQKEAGGRILVRVTSYRVRLLDEDNLAEKYHVDLCRYAGLIPCDSPERVKIEVGQVKVGKTIPEQVVIEIQTL